MARPHAANILSNDDHEAIGDRADQLEAAGGRAAGQCVDLADFLPPADDRLRAPALLELVKTDLACRWNHGQGVRLEHYLDRFPELGTPADLPADLVYEECRVHLLHREPFSLDEVRQRYPAQFADVKEQLDSSTQVGDATDVARPRRPAATPPTQSVKPSAIAAENTAGPVGPGALVKGYRMVSRLGRGNFGEVWLALDTEGGGYEKAIKIVPRHANSPQADYESRSLDLMKQLQARHPYLVGVEKDFEHADQIFIVMEKADGSLHDHWENQYQKGPMEAGELLRFLRHVAEGLDYLHKDGVVHRDIKPQNILLFKGIAKVADFGLARQMANRELTMTSFAGTGKYSAPETLRNEVTKFSDQYSLAVMYAEMRLGRPLFKADSLLAMMNAHLSEAPHLDPLSRAEQQVLLRALAKNPRKRYASCTELARALDATATGPVPGTRAGRRLGRTAAVAAVLLLMVGLAGLSYVAAARTEARVAGFLDKKDVARAWQEVDESSVLALPLRGRLYATIRAAALQETRQALQEGRKADAVHTALALFAKVPDDEVSTTVAQAVTAHVAELTEQGKLAAAADQLRQVPVALPEGDRLLAAIRQRWDDDLQAAYRAGRYGRAREVADERARHDAGPAAQRQRETAGAAESAAEKLGQGKYAEAVGLIPADLPPAVGQALREQVRHDWRARGKRDLDERRYADAVALLKSYAGHFKDDPAIRTDLHAALEGSTQALFAEARYEPLAKMLQENRDVFPEGKKREAPLQAAWLKQALGRFAEAADEAEKRRALDSLGALRRLFPDNAEADAAGKRLRQEFADLLLHRADTEYQQAQQQLQALPAARVLPEKARRYPALLALLREVSDYSPAERAKVDNLREQVRQQYRATSIAQAREDLVQRRDVVEARRHLDLLEKERPAKLSAAEPLEAELKAVRALLVLRTPSLTAAERQQAPRLLAELVNLSAEPALLLQVAQAAAELAVADDDFLRAAKPELTQLVSVRYPAPEHLWPDAVYARLGLARPSGTTDAVTHVLRESRTAYDRRDFDKALASLQKVRLEHLKDAPIRTQYAALALKLGQEVALDRPLLTELRAGLPANDAAALASWRLALARYLDSAALQPLTRAADWQQRLDDCTAAASTLPVVQACQAECLLELGRAAPIEALPATGTPAGDADRQAYLAYMQGRLLAAQKKPVEAAAQLAALKTEGEWLGPIRRERAAVLLQAGAHALRGSAGYPDLAAVDRAYLWLDRALTLRGLTADAALEPAFAVDLTLTAAYKTKADLGLARKLATPLVEESVKLPAADRYRVLLATAEPAELRKAARAKDCPAAALEEAVALGEAQQKTSAADPTATRRQGILCAALAHRLHLDPDHERGRALELYTRALRYDPNALGFQIGKACCEAGQLVAEARQLPEARDRIAPLEKALAVTAALMKKNAADESWADLMLQRSIAALELANYQYTVAYEADAWRQTFDEARAAADRAASATLPHPAPAYVFIAQGHAHEDLAEFAQVERLENYRAALKAFDRAVELSSTPARLARGRCLYRLARSKTDDSPDVLIRAESDLQTVAALDAPEAAEASYWLGKVRRQRGEPDAAAAFLAALRLAKSHDRPDWASLAGDELINLAEQVAVDLKRRTDRAEVDRAFGYLDALQEPIAQLKKVRPTAGTDLFLHQACMRAYFQEVIRGETLGRSERAKDEQLEAAHATYRAGLAWIAKHDTPQHPTYHEVYFLNEWLKFCVYQDQAFTERLGRPLLTPDFPDTLDQTMSAVRHLIEDARGSRAAADSRILGMKTAYYVAKHVNENKKLRGLLKQEDKYAREGVDLLQTLKGESTGYERSWYLGIYLYSQSKDVSQRIRGIDTAAEFVRWENLSDAAYRDSTQKTIDDLKGYRKLLEEQKNAAAP